MALQCLPMFYLEERAMKTTMKIGMLMIGATLCVPVSAADDPNEKLIKARKGEMQVRSFHAGPLFGMARGKMPYDAELAQTSADGLKTALSLNMGRAWKKGTDNSKYDSTRALPEIWSTWPKIAESGKAYGKAVNELAAVAGNGLDALKPAVSNLGKSCKGCHDDFRAEEK